MTCEIRSGYCIDLAKEQIFEEVDCLDDDPRLEISMKKDILRMLRFSEKGRHVSNESSNSFRYFAILNHLCTILTLNILVCLNYYRFHN
mmetsp:Transcript_30942/g.35763  ORF Transcript_30942/g.35763 Transcript_30942/m.35763 type:complete len:89 (+) Transcript_30942:326-592(+)